MTESFTIYYLPFTMHFPLSISREFRGRVVNSKLIIVNAWKIVNGKLLTAYPEAKP